MQQTLQLFIGDTRVDLFKDETVSLTQSIQNVKDIDKVFTEFSKSFNVPASKTNNKIFKHYYNFDITNGYDARTRTPATIELNYMPFKKGNIKLEGVKMKNRKPHTYKITFFGNTTTLKEKIGDDKLGSLNLDEYNVDYDYLEVRQHLGFNPATNDLIVPLITHTQRLYYRDGQHGQGTGNLWYEPGSGTSHHHGVAWNELKYALRVQKIIEKIESRYSITFSDDFFTETNADWNDLFMWLHRKSGSAKFETESDVINLSKCAEMYAIFPQGTDNTIADGCQLEVNQNYEDVEGVTDFNYLEASVTPASGYTTIPYRVIVRRDGVVLYTSDLVTGTHSFGMTQLFGGGWNDFPSGWYTTTIEPTDIMNVENVEWEFNFDINYIQNFDNFESGPFTVGELVFNAALQIPDIGILEFLSGLFKMFNLTAYIDENDVIVVKKLDDFYATGVERDITEYLKTDTSSVDVALPFREITLKYEEPKTFFAAATSQLAGKDWGALEYNGSGTQVNPNAEKFAGPKYEVKLPFGHLQYERFRDVGDDTKLNIMWGWCVDEGQNPVLIKPLLFYPIYQQIKKGATNTSISMISNISLDGEFLDHVSVSGQINIPSNNRSLLPYTIATTLHFDIEVDEYTGGTSFYGTLFENHYKNYLSDTFNKKNRLTTVEAMLPISFLHNYSLADTLIIGENKYRINSITTNLITGDSKLELLNLL